DLAEIRFGRKRSILAPPVRAGRGRRKRQAFSPANAQVIDLRHVEQVDDLPRVAHNAHSSPRFTSTRLGSNPPSRKLSGIGRKRQPLALSRRDFEYRWAPCPERGLTFAIDAKAPRKSPRVQAQSRYTP